MVLGPRKTSARHRRKRCGPWPVQVRFTFGLTSEEYVKQKAWRSASLLCCPFHPKGGCGLARHGSYPRVSPPGCQIARWYCHTAHTTISLLPECLCSRLTSTLCEVEAVVAAFEAAPSQEAASEAIRLDIELPGALRWMRRRVRLVHAGLAAAIGLLPVLFAGCKPTVASFRSVIGAESALLYLRGTAASHLAALPPPLGFGPRPLRRRPKPTAIQQGTGPDPPPGTR